MKEVEYFAFLLPPSIWSKKPYASTWKMTIEDAARRYPGLEPILSSREVRLEGNSDITADSPYSRRSRRKTPEEEALQAWLTSRIGEKSDKLN